jgi:L,D-peptidoglycan transpeptidase YkuD (ErfK/YbiS/YcfS/YnhG family)
LRLASTGSASQLVTVVAAETASTTGTMRLWQRVGGCWREAAGPWRVYLGLAGVSEHHREGDDTTPAGAFAIGPVMYGVSPNPGVRYAYHQLVCGDWWDEDPASPRYNRLVSVPCGVTPGFAARSEALWTETVAYPYLAVIEFNTHPIHRGRGAPGSGIFLHNWTDSPTAGCVAVHRSRLLSLLRWLRPSRHPVIDIAVARPVSGARSPRR